ncbi:MAG: hypothetical protein ACYTG5_08755 [Planctomycetota bacterium]|jgi:hypothetical protein
MTMSPDEFREVVDDYYQGEVGGEAFFDTILGFYDAADQRHKLATLLQLESETKARLRPLVLRLGGDPRELESARAKGRELAMPLEGLDWQEGMAEMREVIRPFMEKYRGRVAEVPPEYRSVAASMASHEDALFRFAELEMSGDGEGSLDDVNAQLHWPL